MVVNEKLIYLHMPKTGGTHITRLIVRTVGGKRLRKHKTLTDYNSGKYIIGSVRNPWDWYLSLWSFGCSGKSPIRYNLTESRINIEIQDIRHPARLLEN